MMILLDIICVRSHKFDFMVTKVLDI